ncbi:MAG: hypothetical protein JWM89_668 [Acidimicrobiales bacterium]|nr:hypothetical protein [Acidimicrobiales bacterium]
MAPAGAKKGEDKGVAEVVTDLWQLVRDYAKQETIDPLKSLGRFLAWGIGGTLLLSLGLVFTSLAILRGLQTETGAHLTGSYTWVPYLAALVVDIVVIALAVRAISKPFRAEEKAA